jgi:energy-coupling factor transporter ATP-binding protein EcfA2
LHTALPYAGWALFFALLLIWAVQKFFGEWISAAAKRLGERFIGGMAGNLNLRAPAVRRYARAILADYDRVPVPFIEKEEHRPSMRKIYIPLKRLDEDDQRSDEDAYLGVRKAKRAVVVGPPGSGKSMLLKSSILIWAEETLRAPGPPHRGRYRLRRRRRQNGPIPVLVELRRCDPSAGVEGLKPLLVEQLASYGFVNGHRFVERALQDGSLTILFDGLDEVGSKIRTEICDLLDRVAKRYSGCQMVVTCRTAIYRDQLSERFPEVVKVADFDDAQVRRFLHNWRRKPDDRSAERLLAVLRETPTMMQLARNPLLLTMIAYIYAHRGRDVRLSRSRAQFYKDAVGFLLRFKPELDYAESVKLAVLQRLALEAQDTAPDNIDRQVLPDSTTVSTVRSLLPATSLDEKDIRPVLTEIITRSGLLKEIKGEPALHFAHLTLQEYLAAAELADRPADLIDRYRKDPAVWRESVKLWCGYVSRDCKPVVEAVFREDPVLAFECLADAVQVDGHLAEEIITHFKERLAQPGNDHEAIVKAFGAVASDQGPRGRAVFELLADIARNKSDSRRSMAIRCLAASRLPKAADVLAALDPDTAGAREALRSMGDLAVPALLARANAGSIDAISDLTAVGTPAAALGLVGLLTDDQNVAQQAAWALASLIRSPDVEEAFKESNLPAPEGERMDWVWAPFRNSSSSTLPEIMGRVAYLINSSSGRWMPPEAKVDRRLALPMSAIPILHALWNRESIVLGGQAAEIVERGLARPSLLPRGKLQFECGELLGILEHPYGIDELTIIGQRIVDDLALPYAPTKLFADLTPQLQSALLSKARPSSIRLQAHPSSTRLLADHSPRADDWEGVLTERREPRLLSASLMASATLVALTIGGLVIYNLIGFFGSWPWFWGPGWLAWVAVASMALCILAWRAQVAFGWHSDFADSVLASIGLATFAIAWLYALGIASRYVDWRTAASITLLGMFVFLLLFDILIRLERAANNPLRGLIELDEQAARSRTSIIVG